MHETEREFIDFAIANGVLRFGDFTLKSGRKSPYFFNSGLFDSGTAMTRLGSHYARAIIRSGIAFDMLFGAAYKGIPLVVAAAMALSGEHGRDVKWAFNRKEAKDHGEHGKLVGAPLGGRVMIIDDVVSAGTSVRESIALIEEAGARPVAIAVALDRQEAGQGNVSALAELARRHGLKSACITSVSSLLEFLQRSPHMHAELSKMREYLRTHGATPRAPAPGSGCASG